MRRNLLNLLAICLLAPLLLCCAAEAENTNLCPAFAETEYTFEGYTCAKTNTRWADAIVNAIWIQNYSTLRPVKTGAPQWTLELIDGEDIGVTMDLHDERLAWFGTYNGMPDHAAQATYRAVCSWDGCEAELTLHFNVKEFPNGAPAGYSFEGVSGAVVETQVGQDVVLSAGLLPEGWAEEGVNPSLQVTPAFDFCTDDHDAATAMSHTLHMDEAGQFTVDTYVHVSNITLMKPLTFKVKDENGNLPGPSVYLDFCSWNGRDSAIYYLGVDDDLSKITNNELQVSDFVTQYWLNGYSTVRNKLEGDPTFSYSVEGTAVFRIEPHPDWDQAAINVYLEEMPEAAEEDIIHLSCTWGENTWEQDYTVSFRDIPEVGLPTGVNFPFDDSLVFELGDDFSPYDLAAFSDGWENPDDDFYEVNLFYIHKNGYEREWQYARYDDAEDKAYYTLDKYGEYDCVAEIISGRLIWRQEFTARVTDENGNIPGAQILLTGPTMNGTITFDYYYYDGLGLEELPNSVYCNQNTMMVEIDYECFDELQALLGGYPTWRMEKLEGAWTPYAEPMRDCVYLRFASMPTSDSVCRVNVICQWGELTASREVVINVMESPVGLPAGIDCAFEEDTYTIQAGETMPNVTTLFTFKDDWAIPDSWMNSSFNYGNSEWSWTPGGIIFNKTGKYRAYISLRYENIACRKDFTLIVTDENGNYPEPGLDIYAQDSYNYYLNDLTDMPDAHGRYSTEDAITHFSMDYNTYWELRETMEGNPQWSLENFSGDFGLTLNVGEEGDYCILGLTEKPTEPGSATATLCCQWGELSFAKQLTVNAVECPDGLPEGITLDFGDTWTIKAGVNVENPADHASFIDGWSLEGEEISSGYHFGRAERAWDNNGFHFTTPGVYKNLFIELGYANIHCQKYYTLIVTDENGNYPQAGLDVYVIGDSNPYVYYLNDLGTMADAQGRFSRDDMLIQINIDYDDYRELKDTIGGAPQWSLEDLSGDFALCLNALDPQWNANYCHIALAKRPTQPGTASATVRCQWGDLSAAIPVTVNAVVCPSGMPEGITLDFGDTWIVKAGEVQQNVTAYASFINNWSIPGCEMTYGYGYANAQREWGMNGFSFKQPGVYGTNGLLAFIELNYHNIVCQKFFTLVVTDANGVLPASAYTSAAETVLTLPGSLEIIEDEAFSGVAAQSVVIPDGCTAIGAYAFANCPNLVEITIPASVNDIDPLAFYGCGTLFVRVGSDYATDYCLNHGLIPVRD